MLVSIERTVPVALEICWRGVDSLGAHLNNVGNKVSRAAGNWADLLVEMKRPYKFSIACENASYPGYVTEKIVSSFLAQTIPIYWGAPGCADEFNPEAFVDASQMSDEELLCAVQKIDNDDAVWEKMLSSPFMTACQYDKFLAELAQYKRFCQRIFDQPLADAKRVPSGYWVDNYLRFFFNAKGVPLSKRGRFYAAIGRETELGDALVRFARKVVR